MILSGLARRLVQDNLISTEEAVQYLQQSQRDNTPFVNYLVNEKVIEAARIANIASNEFGTPVYDLDSHNKQSIPKGLVDKKLISKHQALPLFKRGNRLFLGVTDPANLHALDEIKFNTGLNTDTILVEANKLSNAIDQYVNEQEESLDRNHRQHLNLHLQGTSQTNEHVQYEKK